MFDPLPYDLAPQPVRRRLSPAQLAVVHLRKDDLIEAVRRARDRFASMGCDIGVREMDEALGGAV